MSSSTVLPGLNTRLLVHCRPKEALAVAALCSHAPLGAVFVTPTRQVASAVNATMRRASETAPILFDADRYSGKNRKMAHAGIDARWINTQHELGAAWALTDSGYVADDDLPGLRSILTGARKLADNVIAVLPLANSWWGEGSRQALTSEIGEHGVPVALVLEHHDDPFSSQRTVRGIVELVADVKVPVTILRSDLSGVGVLAFGGAAAAIGTCSALRHLYPLAKNGGGGGRQAQISLLWPQGLAYRTVDKLTDAVAADPDYTHWPCQCFVCYGRSIEWILNSGDQHTNAFRHTVAAIYKLTADLDAPTLTPEQRQLGWLERCRVAQAFSYEVADSSGKGWEPPKALSAWNRALPARVS